MSNTRQTATFLKQRFREAGIRPDTHKGQNFLVDLNLLDVLILEADLSEDDVVLEVGTGTGALTGLLASQAGQVLSIEIDPQLHQLASEELFDVANVELLHCDVLKNKNRIRPEIMDKIAAHVAEGRRFKLVANLPYNIATPLVSNLLLTESVPARMVVTIQKELADRITSPPRTKDYSALSVWIQSLCDAETVRVLGPTVFWPRPKVKSAIIRILPQPEKYARVPQLCEFHAFTRALFLHRRKFLRSALISALKGRLDKPGVDRVMQQLSLGADSRAEQLTVEEILTLFNTVTRQIESASPELE